MTLTATETKLVPIPVSKFDLTLGAYVNVSLSSSQQVGFTPSAGGVEPEPITWYGTSWLVNAVRNLYWLGPLIGPAGLTTLAVGSYVPWIWVVLGSEIIRQPVPDTITVIA